MLAGTDGMSVFPVLGAMSREHREVATVTAYRSLVARGLVEAPTPEEEAEAVRRARSEGPEHVEVPVRVAESLAHVLTLRAGAQLAVAVSRMTAVGEDYRYAYVVEDLVVEEHVTATGLHTFALSARAGLAALLAGWAVHPEASDGTGEAVELPAGEDPTPPEHLLDRLGAALVRADVIVRRPADDRPALVGVFSGPGGTWLSEARRGSGEPVALTPVPVSRVRAVLAETVAR